MHHNSLYIRCCNCKRDITLESQVIIDSAVWCELCTEDDYQDDEEDIYYTGNT